MPATRGQRAEPHADDARIRRVLLLSSFGTDLGPVARSLTRRYGLESTSDEELAVGVEFAGERKAVDAHEFLRAGMAIHLSAFLGIALHAGLSALGVFLAMSLMSMQVWTLAGLALPVLAILAAQGILVFRCARHARYFALGGGHDAAVTAAGFVGYGLGATPTALANMTAVTKKHGPSPLAFLIVPLVAAVFIDVVNAVVLRFMLARL